MKQTDQDEPLVRYLLGTLPEAEELRLEAEYLADAAAQERLVVIEDELVDAYVRNQLSRTDCERLEARFLASPRGQQKLALARSVLALAGHALESRRVRRRWLGIAAAAAVAAIVGLVMSQRGGWRRPSGTERAIEQREPAPRAPVAADPPRTPSEPLPEQRVAFARLEPGLSRDVGALRRIHVPAAATHLTLELHLDADRHPSYRALLLGAGEKARWHARGLQSRRVRDGRAIVLQIPITLFRNAEYTLVLSPDEPGATPVAEFGFAIRLD